METLASKMTPIPAERPPHRAARILGAALAAVLVAIVAQKTIAAFPSMLMEDDGCFYLQIGYNLGRTGISTFDGLNPTSGYHLAWGGILAAVSAVTGLIAPGKTLYLLAVSSVYFFLGFVAAEFVGRNPLEKVAIALLALTSPLFMETQLLACLLLAVGLGLTAVRRSGWWYAAVALVPLVRIDATLMLLPLAAGEWLDGGRERWRRLACFALAAGSGVALHFALMFGLFGHYASTSSLVKKGLSGEEGMGSILARHLRAFNRYELGVFGLLFVLALAAAWPRRPRGGWAMALWVIGPALFVAFHFTVNPLVRVWYLMPGLFVFMAVLVRSERRLLRHAALAMVVLMVAREARAAVLFLADDAATGRTARNERFLDEVRRIVPPKASIYQVDGSGWTGFFSDRIVINGDGLVNSYAYLERLQHAALGDYLRENRIEYLLTNWPLDDVWILKHNGLFVRRDEAVLLADNGSTAAYESFKLWRLRPEYFARDASVQPHRAASQNGVLLSGRGGGVE